MEYDVTISVVAKLEGSIEAKTENQIYVEHLNKTISVDIPNFITKENTMRLKGLGKVSPEGQKGDLYLKFVDINNAGVYSSRQRCRSCGQQLMDDDKFCSKCGALVGHKEDCKKQDRTGVKMGFCSNCGEKLDADSKFCTSCGSLNNQFVHGETKKDYTERRKEYVGSIKKCPSCGEEINSFTAICPACGHEINSQKISDTLEKFIAQVNVCERLIAQTPAANTGWSSWSKSKKVWWVIFNLLFAGIPLAIYLGYPLLTIKYTPRLTKEEKQLVTLVENFPFPNDRESILEALVYAKEKIDFISKEKIDKKSAYWMRLWCSKAEQLKQKADLMFPNDSIVKQSYDEILADEKYVNNKIKYKAVAGGIILVVAVIYFLSRNGTLDDIKDSTTVIEIPETELSCLMPQIEDGKGKVVTNNEYYFSVEYYGISDKEFEDYKKDCKSSGFTIDCENTGSLFDAFNEEGYNIRITYYSSEMHITVSDKIDMRTIIWPDSELAELLPVPKSDCGNINSSSDSCIILYIGDTTKDEYKEYVNECMKKGFTKDVSQTDEHFHADNKDGYHVLIEYRGFNTMFIRIDD